MLSVVLYGIRTMPLVLRFCTKYRDVSMGPPIFKFETGRRDKFNRVFLSQLFCNHLSSCATPTPSSTPSGSLNIDCVNRTFERPRWKCYRRITRTRTRAKVVVSRHRRGPRQSARCGCGLPARPVDRMFCHTTCSRSFTTRTGQTLTSRLSYM